MDNHRKLSVSSDDSDASDKSIDLPPLFNRAGNKPEEIIEWKRKIFDTFKRTIEELKSEYDRNLPTLISQLKELNDITDEIESGVTSAVSKLINMLKQKNLRPTVEKIISDFLKTIKPMTEHLSIISNITADIQQNSEILIKLQIQTPVRGFDDLFKTAKVSDMALVGKNCAEASKEIRMYVNAVHLAAAAQAAVAATAATTSTFLYFALKSAAIVQDLIESHVMNQPANARKPEEIKSETLKFIHYTRETASQFQETLDKIKNVKNTLN